MTFVAAVVVGLVVLPMLRTQYYAARIDSDDPAVRAKALEAVLPEAAGSESLRRRLLVALTDLAHADDGVGPLQARVAAGWLFRNVPSFAELAEARLAGADEASFARLARLMIIGGRWDVPSRPVEQRARWEIRRYRTGQGRDRAHAVRGMADLGRAAAASLRPVLEQALSDPSAEVRRTAVESTAVVLGVGATALLDAATRDAAPANRREAVLMLAAIGPTGPGAEVIARRLADPDASVRVAAAWALGRVTPVPSSTQPAARLLVELLEQDPSAGVRAMAARAVRDRRCLIRHLAERDDVTLRARCLGALRPPLDQRTWEVLTKLVRQERKYWVAAAAVAAAERCAAETSPRGVGEALLARLEQSLQSGEDDLAEACLDALGAVGDPSTMDLLGDVATSLKGRPWVALAASRAAAKIDPVRGVPLLLGMLETRQSSVHDLAVLALARLPAERRPVRELRAALRSPNGPRRTGAVLALALIHHGTRTPDDALLGYLRHRTDPSSREFELRLPRRGYYLCGQRLLGDDAVRTELLSLLAGGGLPPSAVCLSLLAAGDGEGLDAVLLDTTLMPPGFEARAFLADERFGRVVACYLPEAPRVDGRDDPTLQTWQLDRLREWWRVARASGSIPGA